MQQIKTLISKAIKDLYSLDEDVILMNAKKRQWHFSFVWTMKLAKILWKSWEQIAQEIQNEIWNSELINNFEIIKPWFLNFYISDNLLLQRLDEKSCDNKNNKILIEYGQENIAKHMSIGHLRWNIIGQSLSNIYNKLWWTVMTDNHIWDHWTQFWKLIIAYRKWWDDTLIEKDPITELNKLYVKFCQEAENNPDLDDSAREEFLKLEKWDIENKKLWQKFIDYSMIEFKYMHNILWSRFDTYLWESYYTPMLPDIIKEIDDKIWVIWEKWAKIIEFEDMTPLMYVKKDWSTLYATRDLATNKYRIEQLKVKKIAQVVWKEQSLYFKQVIKASEMLWWTKWQVEITHVKNWLVSLPEWKMSTRKWRVILLRKLIETWIEEARKLLESKDSYKQFTKQEQEKLVNDIAIWAIKFNDLYQDRETDITFTWEKALTFEWASGPYMQYAHARTCWILRKSENQIVQKKEIAWFWHEKERELAFHLWNYSDVIEKAAENYKPHLIARYIYDLSQIFNSFYATCSVLQWDSQSTINLRLFLVWKTKDTLKDGLELLWIVAPEKM